MRQLVTSVPRNVARELNHGAIRDFKARALHYHVDLRRPESRREVGVAAPGRRQTLSELVADYLTRRDMPHGLDRNALVELGRHYLEQVERELAEG